MKDKKLSFCEDPKQAKKRKTFQVVLDAALGPVRVDLTGIKAKHVRVAVGDRTRHIQEPYGDLAEEISTAIRKIRTKEVPVSEKLLVAKLLRRDLLLCLMDPVLDHLTDVYREKPAKNILGYDPYAVAVFAGTFLCAYPKTTEGNDTVEENLDLFPEQKEEKD